MLKAEPIGTSKLTDITSFSYKNGPTSGAKNQAGPTFKQYNTPKTTPTTFKVEKQISTIDVFHFSYKTDKLHPLP